MQSGFKVGQQPVAGGEPQTEAAAPEHPPGVRLTRRLRASDARIVGKKTLCSCGKRQPLSEIFILLFFFKCSALVVACSFSRLHAKLSLPLKQLSAVYIHGDHPG